MDFYVYDYLKESISDSKAITSCMNEALEYAGEKRIIFNRKNWHIDEAILLYDDMEVLIDACTIKQNDYVFDNIFRGTNVKVDKDDPYGRPLAVERLKNVSIKGINGAKLMGSDLNKRGFHPVLQEEEDMVGDFWGWRTISICISLCENIEISGLSIFNTKCWALSFDMCAYGNVHDIYIESDVKNGDGINIRAGSSYFRIWNISGSTSDDTVACTALLLSKEDFPHKNYLYPLEPMISIFDGDLRELDIHDISISDIRTGGKHHGVICLASGGLRVYNVDIRNVEDIGQGNRSATVMLYTGYGKDYKDNDIYNISVDSVHSRFSKHAVLINTKVDNVIISNVIQDNPEGSLYSFEQLKGIRIDD